jgi:hypothetical protein
MFLRANVFTLYFSPDFPQMNPREPLLDVQSTAAPRCQTVLRFLLVLIYF